MRWQGRRESNNVEDGRGSRISRGVGIGGVGSVVIGLLALYFNKDPTLLLHALQGGDQTAQRGVSCVRQMLPSSTWPLQCHTLGRFLSTAIRFPPMSKDQCLEGWSRVEA